MLCPSSAKSAWCSGSEERFAAGEWALGVASILTRPAAAPETQPVPMVSRPIRVLLVDDHRVVREAFALMLEGEPDMAVVGQAANGRVALDLVDELEPDIVLMDVNMPILNGIEATRHIHARFPGVRVVGLSMHEEQDRAAAMREAGAVAYVTKSASPEELVGAIRSAVSGA